MYVLLIIDNYVYIYRYEYRNKCMYIHQFYTS